MDVAAAELCRHQDFFFLTSLALASSTKPSDCAGTSPVMAVMLTWCVTHTSNFPGGTARKASRRLALASVAG